MPRLFEEVYVYEAPVRAFHWINVVCIVTLFTTGLIIGNPPVFLQHNEAAFGYWFGTVRFIHFVTAYIFICNIALRLYWAFRGNYFARVLRYLPVSPKQWKQIREELGSYLLIRRGRPQSTAANSLAGLAYALMFLVVIFMVFSGFAMYSAQSDSWWAQLFTWMIPLMGSPARVRLWHHALAWVFPIFVILHVYLVYYDDAAEHGGVISTIFGGWRRVQSK